MFLLLSERGWGGETNRNISEESIIHRLHPGDSGFLFAGYFEREAHAFQ